MKRSTQDTLILYLQNKWDELLYPENAFHHTSKRAAGKRVVRECQVTQLSDEGPQPK